MASLKRCRPLRETAWYKCGLCEQSYHGVVKCALGWAFWKPYVGRPEADQIRQLAMEQLGNGLFAARHYEDALSVREAELSLLRRVGAPDDDLLVVQSNLANTHEALGRDEQTLSMLRDVYFGRVKLSGKEHHETLRAANNYATSLNRLERFEEAKPLFRKTMPVVRRVLGENDFRTLTMRGNYARALYLDDGATLDDLREAVTTLEDTNRIARRVLGNAHPTTNGIEAALRLAQAALRARETPSPSTPSESG